MLFRSQIVSKTEYDSQGRVTTTIVPNGIDVGDVLITYTVYMNTESRIYPAWDSSTHKPRLPVSVTIVDDGNRVVDSYAVDPTNVTFSTIPDGTETLPPTARVSWTHVTYDTHGRLESEDTYHTIPSNGAGSSGANYYRTIYAYDNVGRPYRMVASDGTITWREFDALGRDKETWIGTNSDTATPGNPTAGSSNLKRVSGNFYDGATSGTLVVGDGNMTETRVYFDGPSSETYYSTQNRYDWRNRLEIGRASCRETV